MTRSSAITFATIVVALLACKGKGEDKDLPEAPPLPSGAEEGATESASKGAEGSPSDSSDGGSGDKVADDKGTGDEGTDGKGAGDKGADDKGAGEADEGEDAGSKDEGKDAGTSSPPPVDASIGDLQKRAEACLKRCSAKFEKCKAVDLSKLPECVQKQASCTAACK